MEKGKRIERKEREGERKIRKRGSLRIEEWDEEKEKRQKYRNE